MVLTKNIKKVLTVQDLWPFVIPWGQRTHATTMVVLVVVVVATAAVAAAVVVV